MGWWDVAKRVGEGWATGGGSEIYRAATGKGLIDSASDATGISAGGMLDGAGDLFFGEKRKYGQWGLDAAVGEYGDSKGAYADRMGTLEGERYDLGKAAQNDYTASQVDRGLQMDAAQSYRDTLAGKTPSLAEMQMRQGTQAAAQNGLNTAAGARGGGGNQLLAMQMAQR